MLKIIFLFVYLLCLFYTSMVIFNCFIAVWYDILDTSWIFPTPNLKSTVSQIAHLVNKRWHFGISIYNLRLLLFIGLIIVAKWFQLKKKKKRIFNTYISALIHIFDYKLNSKNLYLTIYILFTSSPVIRILLVSLWIFPTFCYCG